MTEKEQFVVDRMENKWEKEKMLLTSIFSFSNNVFINPVPQDRKKLKLCGIGLNTHHIMLIVDSWQAAHYLLQDQGMALKSIGGD